MPAPRGGARMLRGRDANVTLLFTPFYADAERAMLEIYHAIAKRVDRVRWLFWVLAIGAGIGFVVGVFVTPGTAYFLGALIVLLWSLLMIAMAQSFAQPAPVVDPESGLLERIKVRCWRAYLRLLAIATTGLCVFVLFLSIRAIALIARETMG